MVRFYMIKIVEIQFKETDNLVLLKKEFTNLFDLSVKYFFKISDVKKIHHKEIHLKDFPKTEWCG
jgi:hypothetical protein